MESRILIVDDEIDLLDTLVRLLGRLGYKWRAASSGADAILALEAEVPDLVVTDLHMPGTDGWAVVRHARQYCPPIPVIVLTAYATSEMTPPSSAIFLPCEPHFSLSSPFTS